MTTTSRRTRITAAIASLAAATAAVTLVPHGAQAGHCDGNNVAAVLNQALGATSGGTYIAATVVPSAHPFPGCTAQGLNYPNATVDNAVESVDTRILAPGVTGVNPAYLQGAGGAGSLVAVLNGGGFSNRTVTMTPITQPGGTPGYQYMENGAPKWIQLPAIVTAADSTCITLTVKTPSGAAVATTRYCSLGSN